MKTLTMLFVAVTLVMVGPRSFADSDVVKDVVLITNQNVSSHSEADETLAQYYTISYTLPAGLAADQLQRAILEVYVDVQAMDRDGYANEAPVIEACALSAPYSGVIAEENLVMPTRAMRPVAVGADRRVMLDVTSIVRSNLAGEVENNGIVLGSLTGTRDGKFSVLSGKFDSGAVAQLRIYASGQD